MISSLFIRIGLLLLTAGLWYMGLWPIAIVLTLLYFIRYLAYEMIILGLIIDIHFMTGIIPWYTILFCVIFLLSECLKPRLLAYSN